MAIPNQSLTRSAFVPWPASVAFLKRETAKLDTLIAKQERLIELLREKRQAVISHAVTKGLDPKAPMKESGVEWLDRVPAHWEIVRLGTIFKQIAEAGDENRPVLTVSIHTGVSDREFDEDELERKVTRSEDRSKYIRVQPGDLVYNMMRAWQGGLGAVTVTGLVSPAYIVARPKRDLVTAYVEHLLRTPQAVEKLRLHSRGVTDFRLRLYWEEFKDIKIPLPPASEQRELMGVIGRVELGLVELMEKSRRSDTEGSLSVLRHPVKAVSARFELCQFKPSHGHNPDTMARYGKDPTTKKVEPLLTFKHRALVHFAVSTDQVYMTTELAGGATRFLPFNLGNEGAAGNPPNPLGYRTAYLWERVLQRDNWLHVLGSFVHLAKVEKVGRDGKKTTKEGLIFPRFHQWEAVTSLVTASRVEGPGHTYLIQHSAGSGKTNSISWLAHHLSTLHDANDTKVYDSVIVITDRTVLDSQLQDAIYQFEHKHGVVARITSEHGAKTGKLADALKDAKPIIIVTLQTFPFLLEEIRGETSLKDRRFAVIVDEAHSSMSGASARKLRAVLTAEEVEEGVEITAEDLLVEEMKSRKLPPNVSFYAFTATPKGKTIELFGRRPDPSTAPGPENIPVPFHVYSMQQAIEEGFILDVLLNYTSYKVAYKIAHGGKEYDDKEVDKAEGAKQIARWVRLHPYNIAQKVAVIVEHFRANVAWRLNGEARAMVVTGSRKEAVRYKIAIDKYIKDNGYKDIASLVAFSGDVIDPESGAEKFNEHTMNPGLKGRDIREAFDTVEFNVLLVANKYQTGFDQPKLMAMYVDKRLAGVSTVQTLSRLNRTYPGKEETFVLDFVNDPEAVRLDFEPFFKTAQLAGVSDPNIVHNIQTKLDNPGIYLPAEVEAFAAAYYDPKGTQKTLQAIIAPAVERWRGRMADAKKAKNEEAIDALELFVKDMGSFIRAYDFLSQIIDYGDTDLEKHYIFYKCLIPLLRDETPDKSIDLSALVLTHHKVRDLGKAKIGLGLDGEDHLLKPIGPGTGEPRPEEYIALSALIARMNETFEGELSDADKVAYVQHIAGKMMENESLAQQANQNTKQQFGMGDFHTVMMDAVIDGLDKYQSMAEQVMSNDKVKQDFAKIVLDVVYDGLKAKGGLPGHAPAP